MNVLVYLVPMALLLGLTGLAAFLWSLSSGQYDDVEGAALRILDNDDIKTSSESRSFVQNSEPLRRDSGS
jgi:cbb3-type cytochrome oxidase maturation protein